MSLDYFDKILYINLDHRKDREKCLLDQLAKFNVKKDKIIKISASFDALNGHRGCALSHIKALDLALKKDLKNVLILEDDCIFLQSYNSMNHLLKYFFENIKVWDVFFLGARIFHEQNTKYKMIKKVVKATQTHSYAVNKNYIPVLKKCFEEAYARLKQEMFYAQTIKSAIDQYWQKLQVKDRWYSLDTKLAKQEEFFSDIEYKNKNKNSY
ncbi:MAG: hypothetical protein KR126chlam6_00028 [Candidatus Anoxychlamydiales bacterium]|nr:hypothetical protein [Candidatus Anoxychlamydiales bacterium]